MIEDDGWHDNAVFWYVIQKSCDEPLFYAYDRHGQDAATWVPFGDAFMCRWDAVEGPDGARVYERPGNVIRVVRNDNLL